MRISAFRLHPGDDLRHSLEEYCRDEQIDAAVLLSSVGSLTRAVLRFAGNTSGSIIEGPLEIVSATGTLSKNGIHIHIVVSDGAGKTAGGHLLKGCIVRTTAEIVIGRLDGFVFTREKDAKTGYDELTVKG